MYHKSLIFIVRLTGVVRSLSSLVTARAPARAKRVNFAPPTNLFDILNFTPFQFTTDVLPSTFFISASPDSI
jgi:hypothetical protein